VKFSHKLHTVADRSLSLCLELRQELRLEPKHFLHKAVLQGNAAFVATVLITVYFDKSVQTKVVESIRQ